MHKVVVGGAGMTPFAKRPGTGIRAMSLAAIREALADAGIEAGAVGRVYLGNAVAPTVSRQDMIRGQVAFRDSELAAVPVINVENACASGGSALMLAFEAVSSGQLDVALAVGVEQLSHEDRSRTANALRGSTDIEEIGESDPEGSTGSILMGYYAAEARNYLDTTGAELADFARVAVKNRRHAAGNPRAQYRKPLSLPEVLGNRQIAAPLTLAMCSPVSDGAAALLLCSEAFAARHGLGGPRILASCIAPGTGKGSAPVADAAHAAYEAAGLGPSDLDLIELHDAAAPAELMQYADLGLCADGEGHQLVRRGDTDLGGTIPVNVSGGLMSRGHPLGATGCAQAFELYEQLRGRAAGRQVEGARAGLAANAGGWLAGSYAVSVATVMVKDR